MLFRSGGFEKKTLDRLTAAFTSAELVQMMTILQSAQAELYRSSSRRTDVELCLIRLCDRRLSDTIEGISARLSRLEQGFSAGMPAASAAPAHTPLPSTPEPEGDTMLPPEEGSAPPPSDTDLPPWETGPEPAPTDSPQLSVPEEKPTNHNAVSPKASAPGDWEGFLRTLKEIPPMANSFLRKRDSVNGIFADGILTDRKSVV